MNQAVWKAFRDELQKISQLQSGATDWLRQKAAIEAPKSVIAPQEGAPGFQPMKTKLPGKISPLLTTTGVTRTARASIR